MPEGVECKVSADNEVFVKGPKGELKRRIDRSIGVVQQGNHLHFTRPTDQGRHRSLHGLSRQLVLNMVRGVSEGFVKELELVGVGYRASSQGQLLDLSLGYSHNILVDLPKEVSVSTTQEKGQNVVIRLEAVDNQLLGQVAAKIYALRKPEPYKGKGVKYVGQVLRRKSGKAAGAK